MIYVNRFNFNFKYNIMCIKYYYLLLFLFINTNKFIQYAYKTDDITYIAMYLAIIMYTNTKY